MQYEVSMTVYMGRKRNQRKVPKWLPLKTTSQNHSMFDMHILRKCIHTYTKYEASMSNHMARRTVHRQQ